MHRVLSGECAWVEGEEKSLVEPKATVEPSRSGQEDSRFVCGVEGVWAKVWEGEAKG